MDLQTFTPIVNSLSKKFKIRNTEREDVCQGLFLKLLEIMPKLEGLPESQAKKLCRACLSRHAIDLYNREKRCGNTSSVVLGETVGFLPFDSDIVFDCISVSIDNILCVYESPEKYVETKQLRSMILDWAKKQSKDICLLVTEFVEPSPETKKAYLALSKSPKKVTDIDYVSPWILVKALNLSDRAWLKARSELQKFLNDIENAHVAEVI